METIKLFENIGTIQIETPVDKIIVAIKNLITSGQLKPGDRLPPERLLAERFGVGRGYIREAILKLEFYGLLKTSPQSGSYVAGLSIKILDSIFSDVINFNKDDFASMIEARYYMEINAARLAAERRTKADIAAMEDALADYDRKAKNGEVVVEEDMLFHIKIASATKNTVIESMLLILIPDLIKFIVDNNICHSKRCEISIKEHRKILNAIVDKNPDAAGKAMSEHLKDIMKRRLSI